MNKKIFLSTLLALGVTSSFAVPHPRIGVISEECTGSGDNQKNGVFIALDTENSNDKSEVITNVTTISHIYYTSGHMIFRYCAINLLEDAMPKTKYDYIVLQLDQKCPSGTYPFTRHHDTQDGGKNYNIGALLWPSVINESTADLKYCFVPKDSKSKLSHPFENYPSSEVPSQYGVFANPFHITHAINTLYYYVIHLDDEDSNNGTKFIWGKDIEKNTAIQNRIQKIIYGEDNTYYLATLWPAPTQNAAKSANAKNVDTPKVELKPASAEIKSADYNTIVFELKSAGNTKISIRNINGTEVAKINEQNLNAGVHSINWNSGIMMPRGRYIVTIQHNGSTSAKSIMLK